MAATWRRPSAARGRASSSPPSPRDWLFPTSESRALVRALNAAAANVCFVEIASDKGHDAFLLEEPDFHRALGGFLAGCADRLGV